MAKPNVFIVLSKVEKSLAFEWLVEGLSHKIDFSFVLLHNKKNTPIQLFLEQSKIPVYYYHLDSKFDLIINFLRLVKLFIAKKPNIIHAHLFEASLLALSAGRLVGIKKCIYTRHHGNYHLDHFPSMVKIDRWNNRLAHQIIAISHNVERILIEREGANPNKVITIPHGFKLDYFKNQNQEEINALKIKYAIPANAIVIGCISRYMEWKGVEYTIRAVAEVQKQHPNLFLLLANAHGPYKAVINESLKSLSPGSFCEVNFEPKVNLLYGLMDVFVHVPINQYAEAFGQIYIEALAAGVPSIFTKSGIAVDFIQDKRNAIIVDYKSAKFIKDALLNLLADKDLARQISVQGEIDVAQYSLDKMLSAIDELYK